MIDINEQSLIKNANYNKINFQKKNRPKDFICCIKIKYKYFHNLWKNTSKSLTINIDGLQEAIAIHRWPEKT